MSLVYENEFHDHNSFNRQSNILVINRLVNRINPKYYGLMPFSFFMLVMNG